MFYQTMGVQIQAWATINQLYGYNEYIGQTKRQFGTRLKEHQSVFIGKRENSALSEHTCLTNHTMGWDNFKVIITNRRYHQRLWKALCMLYPSPWSSNPVFSNGGVLSFRSTLVMSISRSCFYQIYAQLVQGDIT